MNKYILELAVVFITNLAFSQNPVFFEQKGDTILLYLSCNGNLTTKEKATYKRIALFEKERLAFKGNVIDNYYPKETIALKANYQNGLYNGRITNYYVNGKIKETGNYKNNNRDSIWTFYYKNQVVEKKIDYSNAQQKLIEYFKNNGKPIFLDGNGIYKGYSNVDYTSCEQHKIKGELKDGVMVGRWTINFSHSVCTEVFENGKFIRGHETPHNRTYESTSMINPSGFPYYKNITILNFLIAYNKSGLYWPTYNKMDFEKGFLSELEQKIKGNISTNDFFYALIEFQLENGIINTKNFKSITNNNQKAEELKTLILSLDKWDKPKEPVSFTIYLPVFWENDLMYL
jgi:antitoxin component YwqK of YwqJK toxin-antitoxin module